MIHPDSQREASEHILRTAVILSRFANKAGGKTWVIDRPSPRKTLRQCEFKKVATRNADLKRWGRKESLGCSLEKLREFLCINFFLAI